MIVVVDNLGVYGGSTTLILRICQWASVKKEKVIVWCDNDKNADIVGSIKDLGVPLTCFQICNFRLLKEKVETLCSEEEDVRFVSFVFNVFMELEKAKYKLKLNYGNWLYSIHPKTLYKGTGVRNRFANYLIRKKYRKTINKLNNNGNLVFMDQDTIDQTAAFYSMCFQKEPTILLLPMLCDPIENVLLEPKIRERFRQKIIFSSARTEFPFKGYLLGLIDDFDALCQRYNNLHLVIVASGEDDDLNKLEEKIKLAENRDKIVLHSWMPYSSLQRLMQDSYVYIGMGTGILEASRFYIPSIPVKYGVYENLASGFFVDEPRRLISEENPSQATIYLEKILKMSFDEYRELSLKSFNMVEAYYGIDRFLNYFLQTEKQRCVLNMMDVLTHTINSFINSRKKVSETCSYEKIKKEDDL